VIDSAAHRPVQNNPLLLAALAEEDLVRLCQRGDSRAFAELMNRHHSGAMKLALSIVRDVADAEDEVQNAFWKAFEHMQQFQHDSKFTTWFTRIVVNQCLMRLRQVRRAKFQYIAEMVIGEEVVAMDLEDGAPDPEDQLGRREIAEVLRQEIRRIPPLMRHVFLMREVQERPMPEVAAELGISVAAAKSRLLRARAELRTRLLKHCGRLGTATLFAS
jgi:RNA polymerase sigma-70 factor (ECF subfamily)